MLICVAGKNNISVDVLEYLYLNNKERYELCVVCNKTEHGENTWQKSLRFFAEKMGIAEYSLADLYDREDLIFLSLEFDQIIDPLKFKSDRLYNIHFSLLPQYKGMYTSILPILNGEEYVGVTFHKIDSGIDTGDIIEQKKFELKDFYTSRDLYLNYIKTGTRLMIENIDRVIEENIAAYPQPSRTSSYYSRKSIDYSNIVIDLCQTADGILRQIRAFSFREYQLPVVYEKRIISAYITDIRSKQKPGTVIYKNETGMMMATIDYDIFLFFDRFDELLDACEMGDLEKAERICSVKEHINAQNEKGCSPLMVATYHNKTDIVKYLISIGADIKMVDNNGANLLMYAKDAFLRSGNTELCLLYREMGLESQLCDYAGKNLNDYIENIPDEQKRYFKEIFFEDK